MKTPLHFVRFVYAGSFVVLSPLFVTSLAPSAHAGEVKSTVTTTRTTIVNAPISSASSAARDSSSSADWKGAPDPSDYTLSALTGLALIDGQPGFSLLVGASKKLIRAGFVPDIANAVSIEAQLGPVFFGSVVPFVVNTHIKWDFKKDEIWSFYATGGFGFNVVSVANVLRSEFFPRVAVGALWTVTPGLRLRAEVSHEFSVLGVEFPL